MGKSQMFADAASIVGDDEADKLEDKSKLVVRSGEEIDPNAVVIRKDDKEEEDPEGEAPEEEVPEEEEIPDEDEEEPDEDEESDRKRKKKKGELSGPEVEEEMGPPEEGTYQSMLGGAQNLDEAEAFLTKSGINLVDSWGVLETVLGNVAPEQRTAIRDVVRDFQRTFDVQAVEALMEVKKSLSGGTTMPKQVDRSEGDVLGNHVLDEAIVTLRTAFDDASETPGDTNTKLAMIQPAVEELANAIKRHIERPDMELGSDAFSLDKLGNIVQEAVAQAVEAKLEPLNAQVAALQARAQAGAGPNAPLTRRAIRMGGNYETPPPRGSLSSVIRRSVGLDE